MSDSRFLRKMVKESKYVCHLSEDTQRLAREELREDEDIRENALEHMKKWAEDNPRIETCRTDPCFLLKFLRAKKFSLPMAQEAMERYLLLRQTYDYAFNNLDCLLPNMDYLFSEGYLFAAPGRDNLGRRWIIARPGVFDPHKYTNADMCKIHGITYETLMEDEESQVRGFVHYGDGAGVSFPHLTLFTPKEAVRIVKNGERTLPMRHKEVWGINVHPSIKYALDFGMSLISEKIKKRVKIFTNLEEAKKNMPDCSMLPKEYGGTMPMAEMIALWKKELLAARPQLMAHDQMRVRLELFSEGAKAGAVSALRNNGSCSSQTDVLAGSFRKLQVD